MLTKNGHAGLYAYKLQAHKICDLKDLQEMRQHFAKERRLRNAERRNVQRNKKQKVKKISNGKRTTVTRMHQSHFCCKCDAHHTGHNKVSCMNLKGVPPKSRFIPRQLRMKSKVVQSNRRVSNRSDKTAANKYEKRVSLTNPEMKNSERGPKTNLDATDISILELHNKFNFASQAYAINAFANPEYSFNQQKRKLKVLNSLIDEGRKNEKQLVKARATLIANSVLTEKELIRSHPRRLFLKRNCAVKQEELKLRRIPLKKHIKIGHKIKNKKGKMRKFDPMERAYSTEEVMMAETEMSSDSNQGSDLFSTMGEAITNMMQTTEPANVTVVEPASSQISVIPEEVKEGDEEEGLQEIEESEIPSGTETELEKKEEKAELEQKEEKEEQNINLNRRMKKKQILYPPFLHHHNKLKLHKFQIRNHHPHQQNHNKN